MIYVYLANGFEEIEALGTVDVLRRCGFEVQTVGVGTLDVKGSHNVVVLADTVDTVAKMSDDIEAVVLPGGLPGTTNLEKSDSVQNAIDYCAENGKIIAAICAAPSILGHKGLLKGKKATSFPDYAKELDGADYTGKPAVIDGNIVTGKGAGCAIEFAAAIANALGKGDEAADVRKSMQCSI